LFHVAGERNVPGGDPAETATAPSTETCERKEHDSPESYRKAGAQHAVEEHGRRELVDREPPESFREAGWPRVRCASGVLVSFLGLVMWQVFFVGIRVGEASNPGPPSRHSDAVEMRLAELRRRFSWHHGDDRCGRLRQQVRDVEIDFMVDQDLPRISPYSRPEAFWYGTAEEKEFHLEEMRLEVAELQRRDQNVRGGAAVKLLHEEMLRDVEAEQLHWEEVQIEVRLLRDAEQEAMDQNLRRRSEEEFAEREQELGQAVLAQEDMFFEYLQSLEGGTATLDEGFWHGSLEAVWEAEVAAGSTQLPCSHGLGLGQ
jgi:hypothetical protein